MEQGWECESWKAAGAEPRPQDRRLLTGGGGGRPWLCGEPAQGGRGARPLRAGLRLSRDAAAKLRCR